MKRWIGYVIAATLLIAIWLLVVLYPIQRDRAEYLKHSAEAEHQLADFQTTVQQLPQFIESQRRLDELKSALHSRLYSKEEILDLFDRLRAGANDFNLEVVEISPPVEELLKLNRQTPHDDRPQFLNLDLTLAGDYVGIGKFIAEIENAPYFRGINHCQVSRNESQPGVTARVGFRALLSGSGDDV